MRRWPWIAAIVLAAAPSAFSSDQVRIAEIGVKGYYDSEVPARLRVLIFHADPQPASVELRVLVHNPGEGQLERVDTYSKRLSLSSNDQRIEDFPILLRFTPKSTIEVQELDTTGRKLSDDVEPFERPLAEEFLIAMLCAQPAVCQQVQSEISFAGGENSQTSKGKVLRFAVMDDPPSEFWGYSPARTVVLARPLAGMSPAQRQALEDYVRQGYALIVIADEVGDADFLSAYKPPSPALSALAMGEGRVVWVPSLASKQLGDLYTGAGASSAVLGWQGGFRVRDILTWVRKRVGMQFRFPTLLWLVVWLAAYVLIAGVGNFVILRKFNRREWGWITLPCISIVFACAMYLSSASNRPHQLRLDDVAIYWMDERSPVAFIERGERVSSNRREQVRVTSGDDEILLGDRNSTGDSLTVNMLGDQTDQDRISHWEVALGPPVAVDLRMLQWSFRDIEFGGLETEPGTVRRIDGSHFRNETGRSFRQAMYVDAQNVYFLGSVPDASEIDLASAASKKPLRQATRCRFCSAMGFPTELSNAQFNQPSPPPEGGDLSSADGTAEFAEISGIVKKPFDLSELIRAWPADAGQAFEARSGIFFGLADESHPRVSFPGKNFVAKGYSVIIVSYEPKP